MAIDYWEKSLDILSVINTCLGESGTGKSNLLNLILNTPGEQHVYFPEGEGAEPCTLQPQV